MPDDAYILDRIEDEAWAVLEPEADTAPGSKGRRPALVLPRDWLPSDASEGDLIRVEIEADGLVRFRVDSGATDERRERLRTMRRRIRRGPSGDVDL